MRVSEDRYARDIRRINLARRLIFHEVRTQWICAWTGLSDERVRNLCRSYGTGSGAVKRHRGPSPSRLATFLRSPTLCSEASAIAGVARVVGVIPPHPVPNARKTLPGVDLGERLCHVYEMFRWFVPISQLSMDQFILLALSLAQGDELKVGRCDECGAAMLLDLLSTNPRRCPWCRRLSPAAGKLPEGTRSKVTQREIDGNAVLEGEEAEVRQRSLF